MKWIKVASAIQPESPGRIPQPPPKVQASPPPTLMAFPVLRHNLHNFRCTPPTLNPSSLPMTTAFFIIIIIWTHYLIEDMKWARSARAWREESSSRFSTLMKWFDWRWWSLWWGDGDGHNGSNELCGRSVPSKLRPQQADRLFSRVTQKLVKICIFVIKRSSPENFQRENFSGGVPTESLRTHGSEYVH